MSLADWEITKRGQWSDPLIRLVHRHEYDRSEPLHYHCNKDPDGWYCAGCRVRVPIEMGLVAKLMGAVPLRDDEEESIRLGNN